MKRFSFAFCLLILATLPVAPALADPVILPNAPNYQWWHGCSPTAAGMLLGYYDINGYQGLRYDNLVPGGPAELSTFGNPNARTNQVIASQGHIADFYVNPTFGATGDDRPGPYHAFNSLADFMGTSQDSEHMGNGLTSAPFFWSPNQRMYTSDGPYPGHTTSEMIGLEKYLHSVGYGAATLYTQLLDTYYYVGSGYGFSFDMFKHEIDSGRPVLLNVGEGGTDLGGHTIFAFGYDDSNGQQLVYFNDTHNPTRTMTWGSSFDMIGNDGNNHHLGGTIWDTAVVLELSGGTLNNAPEPGSLMLFGIGAIGMVGYGWRRRLMTPSSSMVKSAARTSTP